jgi:diacylglycerol kinase (ATP)
VGAIKVIVNPRARKRLDLESFARGLDPRDFSIATTSRRGHALELARQAVAEGFEKVLAVGGDGTVNEILNGLAGHRTSLGIIPTGGANDFATHLGIPVDLNRALQVAMHGTKKEVDLIKVRDRYFATVGGLGFGAKVALRVNNLKGASPAGQTLYRLLGSVIYSTYALFEILFRPEFCGACALVIDGQRRQVRVWSLFVGNQPRLGKKFIIHPAADNGDAWLDICVIKRIRSRLQQLLTLLFAFKGRHTVLPFVETYRARTVTVESEEPLAFFGDGELLNPTPPHIIELVPRALTVIVPNGS